MEELNKLENIILELLGTYQCVTVPGLGSFIYRDSPAASNHFTFELKPGGNTVFFNNAIQADDGILANAVRERLGLSYTEALGQIQTTVKSIEGHLQTKKNLAFGKLGNFFQNAEGHIFFLPSGALNLSRDSYGLPVLKLEELQKPLQQLHKQEKPVVVNEPVFKVHNTETEEEYEVAEILELEEPQRNRGLVWKIAAGFAILTLAGTGWYFGSRVLGNKNKHTETATMDAPAKVETPAESAPENAQVVVPENNTQTTTQDSKPTKATKKAEAKPETEAAKPAQSAETARPKEVTAEIIPTDAFYQKMQQKRGHYYVVGGAFIGEEMAKAECRKWNKVGVNASIHKPENSSLYRVILGRFESEKAASSFIQTMPGFHGSTVAVRDFPILK